MDLPIIRDGLYILMVLIVMREGYEVVTSIWKGTKVYNARCPPPRSNFVKYIIVSRQKVRPKRFESSFFLNGYYAVSQNCCVFL
jgi:hypothetical protein